MFGSSKMEHRISVLEQKVFQLQTKPEHRTYRSLSEAIDANTELSRIRNRLTRLEQQPDPRLAMRSGDV